MWSSHRRPPPLLAPWDRRATQAGQGLAPTSDSSCWLLMESKARVSAYCRMLQKGWQLGAPPNSLGPLCPPERPHYSPFLSPVPTH